MDLREGAGCDIYLLSFISIFIFSGLLVLYRPLFFLLSFIIYAQRAMRCTHLPLLPFFWCFSFTIKRVKKGNWVVTVPV
jgi:hypothetical protein